MYSNPTVEAGGLGSSIFSSEEEILCAMQVLPHAATGQVFRKCGFGFVANIGVGGRGKAPKPA